MNKRIYLLLTLLSFAIQGFSQKGNLQGTVFSEGFAMEFVSIYIAELETGTKTDEQGKFHLDSIEVGEYEIRISFVGFKTISQKIKIEESKTTLLTFELEKDGYMLAGVTVVDKQSGLDSRTPYTLSRIQTNNLGLKGNPAGLMGFLTQEPGIYGAEFGQGIVKPFIRGLGFSRVVTIYQNNKLENHQWGADHGLGINDLGIGNVDVIKGPASILYGSGALGGVILIHDEERYLHTKDWVGRAGASFNSVSLGYRPYFSLGKSFNKGLFVAMDIAQESHADYKDGNNRIIGNSRFNSETYRLHVGINKEHFRNKLSYTFHNQRLGIITDEEMEDSQTLATTRADRQMQLPFQQVKDHILSYSQNTKNSKYVTSLNVSFHVNDRNEIEENENEIDLGLLQTHLFYNTRITFLPIKKWEHNFGLQGSFINTKNKAEAKEILMPDALVFENGLYYLASIRLGKYFMQAGIRYDYRKTTADASAPHLIDFGFVLPGDPSNRKLSSIFNGPTASLGFSKELNYQHKIKLNLSSGFRAPDLAELFSNGNHPGTNRFEVGNANFKREQSFQTDLNWNFENKKFSLATSIYGNIIQNFISFVGTGNINTSGLEIWEFRQDNAFLYGGEIGMNYQVLDRQRLLLSASASLIRGRAIQKNENLSFVPPDNYRIKALYKPFKKANSKFSSEVRLVDTHNRPGYGESSTKGFALWNFGVEHSFKVKNDKKLNLNLTAFNVLNTRYFDHLSLLRAFEVTSAGRNIMLNVQYVF